MTRRNVFTSAILAVLLCGYLSGCGNPNDFHFRYRLTFTVKLNGETKSASSVIDVLYYGVSNTASGFDGRYFYTAYKGVAPIIDLGPYGTLAAAMSPDLREYYRGRGSLNCAPPQSATDLPNAFGLKLDGLRKMPEGERQLPDNLLPAFIWFPAGQPYTSARQICPPAFSSVIGAPIELQSVTIEVARDAPLATRLQIKAPWLDEIRNRPARRDYVERQHF